MNWIELTTEDQLESIKRDSSLKPQVIFKHSIRCATSSMAKSRLERAITPPGILFHFLDLIKYRSLSNKIEEQFMVHHQSPQVLLIKDGKCIYEESHNGISMDEIEEQVGL